MRKSDALVVIPARMGSTRFPGKVLAELDGRPVVRHCWDAAVGAGFPVVVATESKEVVRAVEAFNGSAVLTSPSCVSGTDRVYEAMLKMEKAGKRTFKRIVNLQSDEPFIATATIKKVAQLLEGPDAEMSTAVVPMRDPGRAAEPHVVKAVLAKDGRCLYFSRSPVPSGEGEALQHIGIYGFTRKTLERFVKLPPSPLEKRERLEQLRALEAGIGIRAVRVQHETIAIDTPEDLRRAQECFNKLGVNGGAIG